MEAATPRAAWDDLLSESSSYTHGGRQCQKKKKEVDLNRTLSASEGQN